MPFQTFRLQPPLRPRSPAMLLVPGGLDPRFALSSYRRFFGLRSLLAVSSVASGRIEFVSRAFQARQFYGLSFRFQLLSTPRRRNAVTFNSWREAPPQRDFHPPMHAHSQAHERDRPGRSVWRLAEHIPVCSFVHFFAFSCCLYAGGTAYCVVTLRVATTYRVGRKNVIVWPGWI
jgi:hypothetical protein